MREEQEVHAARKHSGRSMLSESLQYSNPTQFLPVGRMTTDGQEKSHSRSGREGGRVPAAAKHLTVRRRLGGADGGGRREEGKR